MIEIRDTFQDAEIETPKASRGEVWGGDITLPIRLGVLREHRKLPSGFRDRAPPPRPKMDLVRFDLNRTHL